MYSNNFNGGIVMKNKVLKVAIVMLLIITMTMSDFLLVGMNIVQALGNSDNSTNHDNVKFTTYFKTEEKEVSQKEYQIDDNEMKLYMEVAVENEGYFDGVITLKDSNFKLKQNKLSDSITKIEGNTITLNRVRAGNTVEIEVGIEPIIEDSYGKDMLHKESVLKLAGEYKDSTEKKISIEADKKVALKLLSPSNIETTLETKVITNRIYEIGEVKKRIVQIELKSAVQENAYPVKATTFDISLPEESEVVEVISKGTYATNGEADKKLDNYEYDVESNSLKLVIENISKDGKISWKKDVKDSTIVTLTLPEKTEIGTEEYSIKSKVELQGTESKTLEKETKYNLEKEADGLIRTSVDNKEEIYKGKIYSKEEREYNSITNIEVNYANLIEQASITEKTAYRVEAESEDKETSIEYKTTTINKAEVEKILGQEGTLTISNDLGEEIAKITKDSIADENGNILVTYNSGIETINIDITKAVQTGIIRLNHTKTIKAEQYSREEITQLAYLVEQAKVKYETAEYEYEVRKQLRETETIAELAIDKQTLSTATVNEQVKMAVTLKTDSEQYDLYKNPTLTIKLPNGVKNVSNIKAVPLYLDNFTLNTSYNSDTREIVIKLNGEQTKYNVNNANGYIEILADIELDETIPSRQDQILLTYTNEKAVSFRNEGKLVQPISISGFGGLVAFNSITNYNIKTNSVNSKEEQVGSLKMYQDTTEANFQIALVNNTGSDLNGITALGNLPVQGNVSIGKYTFNNTVAATLKSGINIETGKATIYYTSNKNATTEIGKTENGWNTNLDEVTNPVLYMIVISSMSKGTSFVANYTMNIPANLEYDKDMKTTYVVDYTTSVSNVVINATPVGLETGKLLVKLEATVGTDKLEDGMTVKEGEVIRYKATVTNTGSNEAKNVKITGLVPEGTVNVEPLKGEAKGDTSEGEPEGSFVHAGEKYYEEIDTTTVEETIETLKSMSSYIFEYEVRVKSNITQQSIGNQIAVTYNDNIEVKSNKLTNELENANIRVTVKRVANLAELAPNVIGQYFVIVENISDSEQRDIQMKFNMPSEEIVTLNYVEEIGNQAIAKSTEWTIESILAGEYKIYSFYIEVNKGKEANIEVQFSSLATQGGITYRSNVYSESIYGIDVEMNMTSPNEGEYLKADENIEYHIKIKNKSQIPVAMTFIDNIPEQLSIQKIEINGNAVDEKVLDNSIYKILNIEANSTMTLKIYTVVNYDRARLENETITNKASVLYANEELASTGAVSHIIESIKIKEEEPEQPSIPSGPTNPENPSNPDDPSEPDDPTNPENPVIPEQPNKKKYDISGKAWVDQDKDGELKNNDTILKGIKVKLLNIETNEFVRNEENNKDLVVETREDGYYAFEDIIEGKYIIVFEYDNTLYKPTIYEKEGIAESKNSNVVAKSLTVNGEGKHYAATDEIEINQNVANINMGLVFVKQFDINVDKYISKVIVQTSKETTTYEYEGKDFAKVDINAKRMIGSTILVQYTIKVTNTGDVDAYVNSLVDYLPAGLKFSSELNKDWYEVGTDLYTNILESTAIAPGESKEVNLILTKTKTDGNAELINNMAEIQEAYNIYGISDINSTQGNKNKDENDFSSADLMISIQTGTVFNYVALVISMLGIIGVAAYLINKKILRMKF